VPPTPSAPSGAAVDLEEQLREEWLARLKADGVSAVACLLRSSLRDLILPVFDFDDQLVHWYLDAVADDLVTPLQGAVIERLRQRFPGNAKAGDARLVRWRAKTALELCLHALAWVEAGLFQDLAAHSRSFLPDRVQRLVLQPFILPKRTARGSASWGVGRMLAIVAHHDQVVRALSAVFPGQSWKRAEPKDRRERLRVGRDECARLPGGALARAAACEFPSEAALILTAFAVRSPTCSLEPESLRRVIRRIRPLARACDEADRQAGRPVEPSPRARRPRFRPT
jgi:hypothetical protein